MKNEREKSKITDLAALVVFGLFAVCILLVLLAGADSYRAVTLRGEQSYDRRTAVQYLAMHLRQADRAGAVSVQQFDGADALVLRETVDGEGYLTRIYCAQGYLRELFTAEGGSFDPEDGEPLLKADALRISQNGSLLTVCIRFADGDEQTLTMYLRSAQGGAA